MMITANVEYIAGMDMTVTAPLDMGTGQQRFVVAYTLKPGIEKQPDILSAQKSTENMHFANSHKEIDTNQTTHRPDALYLSKSNYSTANYVRLILFENKKHV